MQPLAATAGHPLRARGVLPQRADQLEALPAVLRAVQRRRFRPRVHHVRFGGGRVQLPHPLQRGAGVLGEPDGGGGRFGPGPAQVVGVEHRRPPVRAVAAGQQPRGVAAGVEGDRVDRLCVEVGTFVELPGVTPPAPDEQALAGAHGEQYLGHADHLRGVLVDAFVSDTGQSAPTH